MKPSEQIKTKAEAAWNERIKGRGLSELRQADLLNMELTLAMLDYVDRLEARVRELESRTAYPAGWSPPGR